MQLFKKKIKRIFSGSYLGFFRSFFKGQGFEKFDFRDYQQGDDTKLINRKLSSKFDNLIVNVYRLEKDVNLNIYLDININWFGGQTISNVDMIFSLLDSIVEFGIRNKTRISIFYFLDGKLRVDTIKNVKQKLIVIKNSIITNKNISSKYESNIKKLINLEKRDGKKNIVIFFSDFILVDEQDVSLLKVLSSKKQTFLLKLELCKVLGKNFDGFTFLDKSTNGLQFINLGL